MLIVLLPSPWVPASELPAMAYTTGIKTAWRHCYLSGHRAAECDRACGPIYPRPEETHLQEKLDYLQATRQNLFSDSDAGLVF